MNKAIGEVSGLIRSLMIGYGDKNLDPAVAERALMRSLSFCNYDLRKNYTVANEPRMIYPEITGLHRRLLLLRSLAYLVRIKRRQGAPGWMETERKLLIEYWHTIKNRVGGF